MRRIICPPFGDCEIDYGSNFYLTRRRRGIFFPTGAAAKPTTVLIFHNANELASPNVSSISLTSAAAPYTGNFNSYISPGAAIAALNAITKPITWHLIGAGQSGTDGTTQPSDNGVAGGIGGDGGSYSTLVTTGLTNLAVTVGNSGFPNGAAGGDSILQNNGITIALAPGGGSASLPLGTLTNRGGRGGLTRQTISGFPTGLGGQGGGGAGGPNGVGGDGGTVSPVSFLHSNPALKTSDGGTGGGASNGGRSGFQPADSGFHPKPLFGFGSNLGPQFIPGDGGDGNLPPLIWMGSPPAGANIGGLIFYTQSGFVTAFWGGQGGAGGPSPIPALGSSTCVSDSAWPANGVLSAGQRGAAGGGPFTSGYFANNGVGSELWGRVPLDWSTTSADTSGNLVAAGPGGGSGGGGGGPFNDAGGLSNHSGAPRGGGNISGNYGGGGGGGGNLVSGFTGTQAGGRGGYGVVVAIF